MKNIFLLWLCICCPGKWTLNITQSYTKCITLRDLLQINWKSKLNIKYCKEYRKTSIDWILAALIIHIITLTDRAVAPHLPPTHFFNTLRSSGFPRLQSWINSSFRYQGRVSQLSHVLLQALWGGTSMFTYHHQGPVN